jgi:hypothetical protein
MAVILSIALVVGSTALVQRASADLGYTTVTMSVINTKTNAEKTMQWDVYRYQFEQNFPVPVDDLMERKIKQIFKTNQLIFTYQLDTYEATWHHFKVKISTKEPLTNPVKISFTQKEMLKSQDFTSGRTEVFRTESNSITTYIHSDKDVYQEGQRAVVFINFLDSNERFRDPESVIISFNFAPAGTALEKKKDGSYVYLTPPLERGDNQILVAVRGQDRSLEPESLGIAVLPTK